ncbi:hypothetical protein [Ralstonia solanacearum]|uniref:hypothetical protein n=1 Tax=Ralstonia solanacearum TaxID=305 RepID=UPI0018D0E633|nr:hypothetical protein [Ralstonia solanacearum]
MRTAAWPIHPLAAQTLVTETPSAGALVWRAILSQRKGSGRGLVSICAAGGQGVVAIPERPERMPS